MRLGSASAVPSLGRRSRRDRAFYATVAPFFAIFTVFSLFPVLFSLYLGFNRWDGFGTPKFVGLDNYLRALADPVFRQAIWNTFVVWIASATATVALAFGLTVLTGAYALGPISGGHFNPAGAPHGRHGSGRHHVGDLPSLRADATGVARFNFESRSIAVGSGPADIVGKGLIVHRDPDDYATQPTGNAGPRLACAVIARG